MRHHLTTVPLARLGTDRFNRVAVFCSVKSTVAGSRPISICRLERGSARPRTTGAHVVPAGIKKYVLKKSKRSRSVSRQSVTRVPTLRLSPTVCGFTERASAVHFGGGEWALLSVMARAPWHALPPPPPYLTLPLSPLPCAARTVARHLRQLSASRQG